MAKVLVNRAKVLTSTTGTGVITLGTAIAGFQTFSDAGVQNGDVVRYVIEDGEYWELGTGTYTASGTTLSRNVVESSNSDNAINLSGDALVFVTADASDYVQIDGDVMTGDLTVTNIITSGNVDGRDVSVDGAKLDAIEANATADQTKSDIDALNINADTLDGQHGSYYTAYTDTAVGNMAATFTLFEYTATAGQTVFSGSDENGNTMAFVAVNTMVTMNGIILDPSDYTVTSTTTITLDVAAVVNDVLNVIAFTSFTTADTATSAQGATADAALPKAGGAMTGAITTNSTFDGRDVATDGTKLDGIEAGATADQTASEIRALVESASDSNVFTDADHTKLNAIEASADVTDTANVVAALIAGTNITIAANGTITSTDTNTTYSIQNGELSQNNFTNADHSKLDGIEAGATADQTAAEIKTLVGSATDSNVFTDADHTKLDGIETAATADQTKADIEGLGIDVPATNLTGTIPAARLSTAETQAESDDSTKIATTAYVVDKITTLIGGAPSTLNDLNELAAAINDDANYNTTLTTALATKLPLAGGTITGDLTVTGASILNGGIDINGNLTVDVDGSTITFADGGVNFGQLYNNASGTFNIVNPTQDKDIVFRGNDGGTGIIALTLDMSNAGAATFNSSIDVTGSITTTAAAGDHTVFNSTGADADFRVRTGATSHSLYVEGNTGNIGINTGSPAVRLSGTVLTIDDTSTSGLELTNSGSQAGEMFSDASNTYISERRAGSLVFRTSGSNERMRIDASGNVGIGTNAPTNLMHLKDEGYQLKIEDTSSGNTGEILVSDTSLYFFSDRSNSKASSSMRFGVDGSEDMRIDDSGRLLVGKTSVDNTTVGFRFDGSSGFSSFVRDGNAPLLLVRKSSDGDILQFKKDGTTVGSIGTRSDAIYIGRGDTGISFTDNDDAVYPVSPSGLAIRDAAIDLGISNVRFKDLFLSGVAKVDSYISLGNNGYIRGDYSGELRFQGGSTSTTFFNSDNSVERMRIDSSGRVGIGTNSPSRRLHVKDSGSFVATFEGGTNSYTSWVNSTGTAGYIGSANGLGSGGITDLAVRSENNLIFLTNAGTERMRIDSSGNVLVGKTSANNSDVGTTIYNSTGISTTRSGGSVGIFNRLSSDGTILLLRKDNADVGFIRAEQGDIAIGTGDVMLRFNDGSDCIQPRGTDGAVRDNAIDLGSSSQRFKKVYATDYHGDGSNLTGVGGSTTYGAVGTYGAFHINAGGYPYISAGGTTSGSNLKHFVGQGYLGLPLKESNTPSNNYIGASLSGTWRNMGGAIGVHSSDAFALNIGSIWVRIS